MRRTGDISSTQEQQELKEKKWGLEQQLAVPANTKILALFTITQKKYDVQFTADVIITGYVAIWNKDRIDVNVPGGPDKHWLWFIPITNVFLERPTAGFVVQGDAVVFKTRGIFKGLEGIKSQIPLKEYPADALATGLAPEAEFVLPGQGLQIRYAVTPPLSACSSGLPRAT